MQAQGYPPPTVIPTESNEPVLARPGDDTSASPDSSGWLRYQVHKRVGHSGGVSREETASSVPVKLVDRASSKTDQQSGSITVTDGTEDDSDDNDEFYDASSPLKNLIPGSRRRTSPPVMDPKQQEQRHQQRQRQRQKQRIMTAFQEGKLHCRGVNLKIATAGTTGLELNYQRGKVEPRPATCIKQGLPVRLFKAELHLGLLPVREVFCFKHNIGSNYYRDNVHIGCSRQLLPNREALLDKIEESSAYHTSLYNHCTSGSLMPDGRHKSGHHRIKATTPCRPHNESIIEGYRTEHYQCVFICVPFALDDLRQQLNTKARLEQELGIEELPLVFYHVESGTIEEILYLDDLGITRETLPEVTSNIDHFINFRSACCCPGLDNTLSRLPASQLMLQLLVPPEKVLAISTTSASPFKEEVLKAVQDNDLDAVKFYCQQGANLNAVYEINGQYMNLLGVINRSGRFADHATMAKRYEVGKLLYQQGCRIPVTDNVLESLPRLASFMLDHGEVYCKGKYPMSAISKMLDELAGEGITESEFKIVFNALKKEYSYTELTLYYILCFGDILSSCAELEKSIYQKQSYPESMRRSSNEEHTLQEQKRTLSVLIPLMASYGLHIDPAKLEKHLHSYYPEGFAIFNYQHADPDKPYRDNIKQFINETLEALKQAQTTDQAQSARQALINSWPSRNSARLDQQTTTAPDFIWLQQLIQLPPDTANKNYHQLAQLAIRHYYQMPHPSQLEKIISIETSEPEPLRRYHTEDHVARCQVLAEGIMPLFVQHDSRFQTLCQNNPALYELVPLAMVYHDVVAEVEDKEKEESRAAELFERDMIASGQYPASLITLVANALRNKNTDTMSSVKPPCVSDQQCSEEERLIRHLVRLPDSLDIIRVTSVPPNWTTPTPSGQNTYGFDVRKLDIPDNLKTSAEFMSSFEALMEGAKALAYTTGGAPPDDYSDSGSYLKHHHLRENKATQQYKVSRAVCAYDSVMDTLDDNVRRAIAEQAGINTCLANHSMSALETRGHRAACLESDTNGREYLTSIHDERELRQVRLPTDMTVLEKLMFEQQGPDCLPEDKRKQVESEIARLRKFHIQPPLGTLVQKTLEDERAKTTLGDHYNIEVVQEERFCGYNNDGSRKKVHLLVPRQKRVNPT